MIPDIAAKSGIFASDIPILNGSKRANEHFSGTFWQRAMHVADRPRRWRRPPQLCLSSALAEFPRLPHIFAQSEAI
jgi:hypothetical protein